MDTINLQLVEIALDRANGTDFERFFQAFYPSLAGIEFIPLGGAHDGGADAFQDIGLFENKEDHRKIFYQATTQEDHRAKIRHTVNRLREFGRNLEFLYYFSSHIVRLIDREEEKLSQELGISVRIRDRKWITANVNQSPQTREAFRSYLQPAVAFLTQQGGATTVGNSPNIPARTMCVFLGQEIDRRHGKADLYEAVTDSLILWALEGTDPAKGQFMRRNDILSKIEEVLPSARQFIRGVLESRLRMLASKSNQSGREIRWYRGQDKFCLPYETRQIVEKENTEDEFLKLQVLNLYEQRSIDYLGNEKSIDSKQIARITHRALELTFEKEGLELSAFLSGAQDENQYRTISDQVDEAIEEAGLSGESAVRAKEVALVILGKAFYDSTEDERIYYGKLSRTYTLMLTLRNEPKIVEYFKGMSSDFVLFVGADIIIRALSERYLATEDQMTINMLNILRDAGSTLILTQMTVEEVQAHLEGTDYEFRDKFSHMERFITREISRHSNKIMIRAYFYAKLEPVVDSTPASWNSFIEQICSHHKLHNSSESREQIKNYLIEKFGFIYFDLNDLENLTNKDEVDQLTEKVERVKSEEILARNDALHILAVYGKRYKLRETHKPSPYGYRTWWLTHERKVLQVARELMRQNGSQYIIRPEFILNFVALSPKMEEVRRSYNSIFPTLLGIRLSNRMREEIFADVMNRVQELGDLDEARTKSKMIELSSKLKGDNYKTYEAGFDKMKAPKTIH